MGLTSSCCLFTLLTAAVSTVTAIITAAAAVVRRHVNDNAFNVQRQALTQQVSVGYVNT
jgi:hypothetical protein